MWKPAWFTPKTTRIAEKSTFSIFEHFFRGFSTKTSGFSCPRTKKSTFHSLGKLSRHLKGTLKNSRSWGNVKNRMVYTQNHQIGSKIDFFHFWALFSRFLDKNQWFFVLIRNKHCVSRFEKAFETFKKYFSMKFVTQKCS